MLPRRSVARDLPVERRASRGREDRPRAEVQGSMMKPGEHVEKGAGERGSDGERADQVVPLDLSVEGSVEVGSAKWSKPKQGKGRLLLHQGSLTVYLPPKDVYSIPLETVTKVIKRKNMDAAGHLYLVTGDLKAPTHQVKVTPSDDKSRENMETVRDAIEEHLYRNFDPSPERAERKVSSKRNRTTGEPRRMGSKNPRTERLTLSYKNLDQVDLNTDSSRRRSRLMKAREPESRSALRRRTATRRDPAMRPDVMRAVDSEEGVKVVDKHSPRGTAAEGVVALDSENDSGSAELPKRRPSARSEQEPSDEGGADVEETLEAGHVAATPESAAVRAEEATVDRAELKGEDADAALAKRLQASPPPRVTRSTTKLEAGRTRDRDPQTRSAHAEGAVESTGGVRRGAVSEAVGMQNLGNTCYANAIFQSLLSLHVFKSMLRTTERGIPTDKADDYLLTNLLKLAQARSTKDGDKVEPLCPQKALEAYRGRAPGFDAGLQEDAQEFLLTVLDQLEKETLADNDEGDAPPGSPEDADPVTKTFSCVMRTTYTCLKCGACAEPRLELHKDLSLTVPDAAEGGAKTGARPSIREALRNYFEPEEISKKCDYCLCEATATRRSTIALLPQVLVLHLKRSLTDADGSHVKATRPIKIPMYLNLEEFAGAACGPDLFIKPSYSDASADVEASSSEEADSADELREPSPVAVHSEGDEERDLQRAIQNSLHAARSGKPPSPKRGGGSREDALSVEKGEPVDLEAAPASRPEPVVVRPEPVVVADSEDRPGREPRAKDGGENPPRPASPDPPREPFDVCGYLGKSSPHGALDRSVCARYRLQSIVRHHGESSASGHYVADIRNPLSGLWYEYNDECVSRIETNFPYPDRLRQENGYIFFYVHQGYLL